MMKREYIKPATKVVMCRPMALCAGSPTSDSPTSDNEWGTTLDDKDNTGVGENEPDPGNYSRRTLWDDM